MKRQIRFYAAVRPDHKQVDLWNPFSHSFIPVDQKLQHILALLWDRGIVTEASCQGSRAISGESLANHSYILFYDRSDAIWFASMLLEKQLECHLESKAMRGSVAIRFTPYAIPAIVKELETHRRHQHARAQSSRRRIEKHRPGGDVEADLGAKHQI